MDFILIDNQAKIILNNSLIFYPVDSLPFLKEYPSMVLSITSVDNDALLIKLLGELRAVMKAGNQNSALAKTFAEKVEEVINLFNLGLNPKGSVTHPEKYIKNIISQINKLNDKQLFAGLSLMCKDLQSSLNDEHPIIDIIDTVLKNEQKINSSSPLFQEEPVFKSSAGGTLKKGWYTGEIAFLLTDPSIVHDWTTIPGQNIFEQFKEKFKDTIYKSKDYPQIKSENGLNSQPDIPITLITSILGKSTNTLLVPILVYLVLLLFKTEKAVVIQE